MNLQKTKIDKALKYLWLINGLMLFGVFSMSIFKNIFPSEKIETDEYEDIYVGEIVEKAKVEGKILQGVTHEAPRPINNSKNLYILISALTYEEAKSYKEAAASAGDISLSFYNCINILFLDEDYQAIGTLLDKKASISDYEIPHKWNKEPDTTIQNIAYFIGFEDTNGDNRLNSKDLHDLYLSDLNGKNLVQVSKNIDIESYHFQKNHSELVISYKERNKQKEEYKKQKYAIYDIKSKKMHFLRDIDSAILAIEKDLIK